MKVKDMPNYGMMLKRWLTIRTPRVIMSESMVPGSMRIIHSIVPYDGTSPASAHVTRMHDRGVYTDRRSWQRCGAVLLCAVSRAMWSFRGAVCASVGCEVDAQINYYRLCYQ
jgi:hypothetical protein